ncbi:MAG: response regulator, partial [bacterium]|nr:response regulator [bacterium]
MRKILIVDDEEKLLELLSRALSKDKAFEVVTASTIEEAEYAIKHACFDIILADIRLTGVLGRQGLELLPYVAEKSPRTKVIIMTAYGSPEIEEEAYEKGAFYYFEKPIDLRILCQKLDEIGIGSRKS